jgi:UrcA family protein
MKTSHHFAVVGLFVGSMASSIANAHMPPAPTRVVEYADLNVTQQPGAEALYRRIENAARSVCRVDATEPLAYVAQMRTCEEDAVAHAVADADLPMLTGLYAERADRQTARRVTSVDTAMP